MSFPQLTSVCLDPLRWDRWLITSRTDRPALRMNRAARPLSSTAERKPSGRARKKLRYHFASNFFFLKKKKARSHRTSDHSIAVEHLSAFCQLTWSVQASGSDKVVRTVPIKLTEWIKFLENDAHESKKENQSSKKFKNDSAMTGLQPSCKFKPTAE